MDIDAKRLYFGPKICVFNLPKGAEFLTPPEAFNLAEKLRSYILVKEIMAPASEKAVWGWLQNVLVQSYYHCKKNVCW